MNTVFDAGATHTSLDHVGPALKAAGAAIRRLGLNHWQVDYLGQRLHLRQSDIWFCLTGGHHENFARNTAGPFPRPEQLLAGNRLLAGGARFSLDAQGGIRLQAEVLGMDEWDPAPALARACAGIAAGNRILEGQAGDPIPSSGATDAVEPSPQLREMLVAACREGGWDCDESTSGQLVVQLHAARADRSANLIPELGQGFRIQVPLIDFTSWPDPCREALGVWLLHGSSLFRLARPVLFQNESRGCARLEVRVDYPWPPSLVGRALAGLAVALDCCADDAHALAHEPIAKEYLCLWGQDNHQTNKKGVNA